jgi:3-methyladenine DNA glycosylase/8-oxoguanine DNA glycosylase
VKPSAAQLCVLRKRDPVLGEALARVPRFPGFPSAEQRSYQSHFHALASAIVYQQLAVKAARTIYDRVRRLTPGTRFPTAAQLGALSDDELRGAGLSRNKLAALRDLSRRVASGELRLAALARRSDEEIIEELVQVRGIGRWSAQMFLIFRLGRLDVLPDGDLAVREGLRRLDGLDARPTPGETLERGEVWRPLRSVASWVLWRLAVPEVF